MKKFINYLLNFCLMGILLVSIYVGTCKGYSAYLDTQSKLEELYTQNQILFEVWVETTQELINADRDIKAEMHELVKKPSYKYLKSVTVRILQEASDHDTIGTGTIIKVTDDYTYILTNKHIAPMDNKDNVYVVLGGRNIKAEVVKNSAFADLSLIKIIGKLKNKQIIKGISKAYPSDNVYSVGMYLGNYYIYTEGTFAGYAETYTLINAPSSFGCSGSGVFDKEGKLIAIIFATSRLSFFDTDSAKAVCVSIEAINLFLYGII